MITFSLVILLIKTDLLLRGYNRQPNNTILLLLSVPFGIFTDKDSYYIYIYIYIVFV